MLVAAKADKLCAELQTILLSPYPCGTSPCIQTIFGPTQSNFYWSSTTYAGGSGTAWDVSFGHGMVSFTGKTTSDDYVRAVRGGL